MDSSLAAAVTPLIRNGSRGQEVLLVLTLPAGLSPECQVRLRGLADSSASATDVAGSWAVHTLEGADNRRLIPVPLREKPYEVRIELCGPGVQAHTTVHVTPPPRYQLLLVHSSHQDAGWGDLPSGMRSTYRRWLDCVIEACRATEDRPETERFRWFVETAWLMEDWLAGATPAEVQEMRRRCQAGQVELPGLYCSVIPELLDPDMLADLVGRAEHVAAQMGVRPQSAMMNDVPSLHPMLIQALSAAGVNALTWGPNTHHSQRIDLPEPLMPHYFACRTAEGRTVKVWRHLDDGVCGAYTAGMPFIAATAQHDGMAGLALALHDRLARWQNRGHTTLLVPAMSDLSFPEPGLCDVVRSWNQAFLWPQARLVSHFEAHQILSRQHAGRVPESSGLLPGAWADMSITMPDLTATHEQAKRDLHLAGVAAAFRTQLGGGPQHAPAIDQARCDTLMHAEHTFGLSHSPDRYPAPGRNHFDESAEFARSARRAARDASLRDLDFLSRRMPLPAGPNVVVWNPLPWTRSEPVEVRLCLKHLRHKQSFAVRDLATGRLLPVHVPDGLVDQPNYHHISEKHFVSAMFLAPEVPGFGWRAFALEAVDELPQAGGSWQPSSGNDGLKGVLVAGQQELAADLVSGSAARWTVAGRCLSSMSDDGLLLGLAQWTTQAPAKVRLKPWLENERYFRTIGRRDMEACEVEPLTAGPLGAGWRTRAGLGDGGAVTQEWFAYAHEPRLDLVCTIRPPRPEPVVALSIAFPFNMAAPQVRCDLSGTPADPYRDLPAGAWRDMLAATWIQQWDDDTGVVWTSLDAPMASINGWNRHCWLDRIAQGPAQIHAHVMGAGYWRCNAPLTLREEVACRFSLLGWTGSWSQERGANWAMERRHPLAARVVENSAGGPLKTPSGSCMRMQDSSGREAGAQLVRTAAVRPLPDGSLAVRLLGGTSGGQVRLSAVQSTIESCVRTTPGGMNPLPIQAAGGEVCCDIRPGELVDLRMKLRG